MTPRDPRKHPPPRSEEKPLPGPKGPRTPYPVNDPPDSLGPGSDPDYIPPTPDDPVGER
ncbi:MAG: hypothetical protein AB7K04_00710 [Pseudorhodoplanes sp.]